MNVQPVVTVIIPALNESEGILATIAHVPKAKLNEIGYDVEILVVDNGSTDNTVDLAERAGATVVIEQRRGYGHALKCGFANAKGDIIATVDADDTYPLEDIPKLVAMIGKENLDFVTTDRLTLLKNDAMTLQNKIGNTALSLVMRILFFLNIKDCESGMWVFKKDILAHLKCASNSWPLSHEIKLEACYFNKFRWREVPIQYRNRLGKTNLTATWKVGFTDLFHIIKKRFIR